MLALPKIKPVLVSLGWAVSIAGITLAAIFQGFLTPLGVGNLLQSVTNRSEPVLFYVGIFAVSILASVIIDDVSKAVLSFFASYGLAGAITYFVLALPGFVGAYPDPELLVRLAIVLTFTASFPFPLMIELAGTLSGSWLAERFSGVLSTSPS
jgi:hypothetical protein